MANYKMVDMDWLEPELTECANILREKRGSTSEIAFPDGFKSLLSLLPSDSNSGSQYYASTIPSTTTSDMQTYSFDIGFEPKLFVISTVNSFDNSSSTTRYVTCYWHCSDLTGAGYGQYTGAVVLYKNGSNPSAGAISAITNGHTYTYNNGKVTIYLANVQGTSTTTQYRLRKGTLYRVFAMA